MLNKMNKVLLKCTIASALGGLLFGYNTVIINGAMIDLVKHFQLTPALQGWTVSSALIGCILGTILMQLLAIMFLASSAGCVAANDYRNTGIHSHRKFGRKPIPVLSLK
jgi:MFS family permease